MRIASIAAIFISATIHATFTAAANVCNNSPELCSRTYSNVTHLGAHDSAFLRDASTSYSLAGNQFYNATTALSAGVRLLQAQVHNLNGVLQLCHSSCSILDGGTLEAWLTKIKYWMDMNTSDVVTILLVNSDNNSTASYGTVFTNSGIAVHGYTPTATMGGATWPSLQSLISNNTRLVTFITNIEASSAYPYLLPEFNYVFETAYGQTDTSQFNCNVDRPSGLASPTVAISRGYLPLLNHFRYTDFGFGITTPDIANITLTNSNSSTTAGALFAEAHSCNSQWGIKPTFILVDFFNVGPAMDSADMLNGISGAASGRTSLSTNVLTGNSTSTNMPAASSASSASLAPSASSTTAASTPSRSAGVTNTTPTATGTGATSSPASDARLNSVGSFMQSLQYIAVVYAFFVSVF